MLFSTLFIFGLCGTSSSQFVAVEPSMVGSPINCAAVSCPAFACQTASCPAYPGATCRTDVCGCNPRFYVNGNEVKCDSNQQPQQQPCRNPVNCWANPCRFSSCPAFPEATCVADYCGGCFAKYYMNGKEVDCQGPRQEPTTQAPTVEGECPYDWLRLMVRCSRPQEELNQCNQCERKGKLCCPHGCGKICKEPVRSRVQGVCPVDELAPLVRCANQTDYCNGQCENKGQLCCSHGCNKICKSPVAATTPTPKVTGQCPAEEMMAMCFAFGPDECNNCEARGQLCCRHLCGQKCKDPERPSTTTVPVPTFRPADHEDCPAPTVLAKCAAFGPDECDNCEARGQVCCNHMCGRICKDPKKQLLQDPRCPVLPPGTVGICIDNCNNCEARGQVCCSNGCGRQCTNPVTNVRTTTPRQIPSGPQCPPLEPGTFGHCAEMCNNCEARGQLCCSNGCGHVCKDPVYYRG